jgi:hypothetical protein
MASGSGFLIGSRIVMTARHVVDPPEGPKPCNVKVRIGSRWIRVQTWHWWYNRRPADGRIVDLAVLKLAQRVDAYLFNIRPTKVPLGTNLAMVGHPLGNGVSVTQGRLIARNRYQGVPLILVNLLGAEGASGSAFLDGEGNVVGVLQAGIGGKDFFGQRTSGAIVGLDLNAWWGNGKRYLCRAYPSGGIPMCATKPANPTRPATPTPEAPPSCSDKVWLTAVGIPWRDASQSWHAWPSSSTEGTAPLYAAFDLLEEAATWASAADLPPCSPPLLQAAAGIADIYQLTEDAREKVDRFVDLDPNDVDRQTILDIAGQALSALGSRVDAVDHAFASAD